MPAQRRGAGRRKTGSRAAPKAGRRTRLAPQPPAKREDALVAAATEMLDRAYAPYSKFRVGAAIRTEDGSVVTGCNVENASYGLCLCAERVAVGRMIAEGHHTPAAVVVVTESSPPSPPCGMCLQTLAELAVDMPVILANREGERLRLHLKDLLPVRFHREALERGRNG